MERMELTFDLYPSKPSSSNKTSATTAFPFKFRFTIPFCPAIAIKSIHSLKSQEPKSKISKPFGLFSFTFGKKPLPQEEK